eukprot:4758388-Amphidinium_carterae.1
MERLRVFLERAQRHTLFLPEVPVLKELQAREGLETTPDLAHFFLSKEQAESRGVALLWEFAVATSGIPSMLVKSALQAASTPRQPQIPPPPRMQYK